MYTVFHRTWWIENPEWPNGLDPCAGEETVIQQNIPTAEEAQAVCRVWNDTHDPGRLSRKAEFKGDD